MCKNQGPLVQRRRSAADIFFTGLSAVPTAEAHKEEPFSANTRSGRLLREVASELSSATVHYTNLVKCLPLRNDRIRYPSRTELELCYRNYRAELVHLVPQKVVLFGQLVSDFIAHKLGLTFAAPVREFDFPVARCGDVTFLSAYHPSYVLVYKRRKLDVYKRRLAAFLEA